MRNKFLTTTAAGLAIAAGSFGLGSAVLVSTAGATTPAPASTSATHPSTLRTWLKDHHRQVARAVVAISAKSIGIPAATLVSQLKAGSSIAAVATAHQVAPQTVVNALVQAGEARVAKAVSNHKLTAAQARTIDARLPAVVDRLVNHTFGHHTTTAPAAG